MQFTFQPVIARNESALWILYFVGFLSFRKKTGKSSFQFRSCILLAVRGVKKGWVVDEAAPAWPKGVKFVMQQVEPFGPMRQIFLLRLLDKFLQICVVGRGNRNRQPQQYK